MSQYFERTEGAHNTLDVINALTKLNWQPNKKDSASTIYWILTEQTNKGKERIDFQVDSLIAAMKLFNAKEYTAKDETKKLFWKGKKQIVTAELIRIGEPAVIPLRTYAVEKS